MLVLDIITYIVCVCCLFFFLFFFFFIYLFYFILSDTYRSNQTKHTIVRLNISITIRPDKIGYFARCMLQYVLNT